MKHVLEKEDLWGDTVLKGLNEQQAEGMKVLLSGKNVFLTGGAGSGKSFLSKRFIDTMKENGKKIAVTASTGVAAVLVDGQTFHRYFGFGNATDVEAMVKSGLDRMEVYKRLCNVDCILVDEVSMISANYITAAEQIARTVKGNTKPWGGIQIVMVGDFRQLPPVVTSSNRSEGPGRPWAFKSEAWKASEFHPVMLGKSMRADNPEFLDLLSDARLGKKTDRLVNFLCSKVVEGAVSTDIPRLFARKANVDQYNARELSKIPGKLYTYATEYTGNDGAVKDLKKNCPIPEVLNFKIGALVMMRNNDIEGKYVNGTLGTVVDVIESNSKSALVRVELANKKSVMIPIFSFISANEIGDVMGIATNFPFSLAWATTIHKSQGATMDRALLELRSLWEPGQLYVALSRISGPDGVYIKDWCERSFKKPDREVSEFHQKLLEQIERRSANAFETELN